MRIRAWHAPDNSHCAGASDGHGLLLAKQMSALGAAIAMVARGQDRLEAAAATITDAPVHPIPGDMLDQDSIKAAAETALQRLGGLDVLVISTANSTPEYLSKDASYDTLQRVHVQGTDTLIKVAPSPSPQRLRRHPPDHPSTSVHLLWFLQ